MNSYLSVIYHSDPFYFILPVNVCSTLSMMCVCVCVCVLTTASQHSFIHSFIQLLNRSFIISFVHSLMFYSNINMFQLPTTHFLFIVQVTYRPMGPGVEILYVMYLLNFHVYNTCHYNKKNYLLICAGVP